MVGKGGRFGMRSRVEMGKGRALRYEKETHLFGCFVKVLLEEKVRDECEGSERGNNMIWDIFSRGLPVIFFQ